MDKTESLKALIAKDKREQAQNEDFDGGHLAPSPIAFDGFPVPIHFDEMSDERQAQFKPFQEEGSTEVAELAFMMGWSSISSSKFGKDRKERASGKSGNITNALKFIKIAKDCGADFIELAVEACHTVGGRNHENPISARELKDFATDYQTKWKKENKEAAYKEGLYNPKDEGAVLTQSFTCVEQGLGGFDANKFRSERLKDIPPIPTPSSIEEQGETLQDYFIDVEADEFIEIKRETPITMRMARAGYSKEEIENFCNCVFGNLAHANTPLDESQLVKQIIRLYAKEREQRDSALANKTRNTELNVYLRTAAEDTEEELGIEAVAPVSDVYTARKLIISALQNEEFAKRLFADNEGVWKFIDSGVLRVVWRVVEKMYKKRGLKSAEIGKIDDFQAELSSDRKIFKGKMSYAEQLDGTFIPADDKDYKKDKDYDGKLRVEWTHIVKRAKEEFNEVITEELFDGFLTKVEREFYVRKMSAANRYGNDEVYHSFAKKAQSVNKKKLPFSDAGVFKYEVGDMSPDYIYELMKNNNELFVCPTPLVKLNQKLQSNGLLRGEVSAVVAPTMAGKTWFCIAQFLEAARAGADVLFVPLETREPIIQNRIVQNIACLAEENAIKDKEVKHETLGLIRDYTGEYYSAPRLSSFRNQMAVKIAVMMGMQAMFPNSKLVIRDRSSLAKTIDDIRADVDDFEAKYEKTPDLLIIDGLSDIEPPANESRQVWEATRNITKALHDFVIEKNIHAFITAQANRTGIKKQKEGETIDMSDTAESITLAAKASLVLVLQNNKHELEHEIQRAAVEKNRHGVAPFKIVFARKLGSGIPVIRGSDMIVKTSATDKVNKRSEMDAQRKSILGGK